MRENGNGCLKTWRHGLKRKCRVYAISILLVLFSLSAGAAPRYRSVLNQWTRSDKVYVMENIEARVIWHATYFSREYRKARLDQISRLSDWTMAEYQRSLEEDRAEGEKYDVFFVSVYAGSSQFPEIGKDEGRWRIVLDVEGEGEVPSISFERIRVTQLERTIYPYIDKWSNAYLVKFPKMIREGKPFQLRMGGIPAKSKLAWE